MEQEELEFDEAPVPAVQEPGLYRELPRLVGWEDVGVESAGARLFEHVAHLLHPGVVVRRLLVFDGGCGVALDLAQDELCRVVLLLQEIETRNTGFPGAVFGVDGSGLLEGVDELRFDARMNNQDVHPSIIGPVCCVSFGSRISCSCTGARSKRSSPIQAGRRLPSGGMLTEGASR